MGVCTSHDALLRARLSGPVVAHSCSSFGCPLASYLSSSPSSNLRRQSGLISSPSPTPWRRRRREGGRSPRLRPAHFQRRLPPSIGQSYSTRKPWTRSTPPSLPSSTSVAGPQFGPHPAPFLLGPSRRSDSSPMPYGRVWFPLFRLLQCGAIPLSDPHDAPRAGVHYSSGDRKSVV